MKAASLSAGCRRVEMKDVYLSLSALLRREAYTHHETFAGCRARHFSRSVRRRNTPDTVTEHATSQRPFRRYKESLGHPLSSYVKERPGLDALAEQFNEQDLTIRGYIGATRNANKNLKFAEIVDPYIRTAAQLTFLRKQMAERFDELNFKEGSPVIVRGHFRERPTKEVADSREILVPMFGLVNRSPGHEFVVTSITALNEMPDDIIVSSEANVPPEQRHLQIRTSRDLREALRQRSRVAASCRRTLSNLGFDEIETPILFKSTPEGAREFLVPTRQKGFAYALPQSPQQYKQLLMSSGIPRYFQLAKCFRDEDMRADRQPEFTQVDIEMSFVDSRAVMQATELLISTIWREIGRPAQKPSEGEETAKGVVHKFQVMQYQDAMSKFGIDKPDLRYTMFPIQMTRQDSLPTSFTGMMTSIQRPVVDFIKLDERYTVADLKEFLDSPAATPYHTNPAGPPAVLTFDPSRPLSGLSALGHEGADGFISETQPEPGDTFIFQAREDKPFHGGSIPLGELRRDVIRFGLKKDLIEKAKEDVFAWIVNFPLFQPTDSSEPGQGGSAGIQSTHHPFTAPKTPEDFDHMLNDPLKAVGDHYDLVINGIEVGGGSKRIHDAAVQEHVFSNILKVSAERVEDFRHLIEALRAGCPPHAGIALGFDRLMTILCDKDSVRDVIAFPKWGSNGEDKLVKSPSAITDEQLDTYHLSKRE